MPVRLHPDKSGLTSRAFVSTGSNCAYCWAASAAVHSSAECVQAATPTTPSSTTTGIERHEMENTQGSTALIREEIQSGRGDTSHPRPLRDHFCLISRSLRTSLTPSTERASSPARAFMVVESTNPVSCTTPFCVPTLIWYALVVESSVSFALTDAVSMLSSTFWPAVASGFVLTRRSLRTSLTPVIERATFVACSFCWVLSTKPPSCTTPRYVSTLIWPALVIGSSIRAIFTLEVSVLSSMSSPADCCVRVAEQALAIASTPRIAVNLTIPVFMLVSYLLP